MLDLGKPDPNLKAEAGTLRAITMPASASAAPVNDRLLRRGRYVVTPLWAVAPILSDVAASFLPFCPNAAEFRCSGFPGGVEVLMFFVFLCGIEQSVRWHLRRRHVWEPRLLGRASFQAVAFPDTWQSRRAESVPAGFARFAGHPHDDVEHSQKRQSG